jgi:lipopolysaccharide heptosyltransferase II
MLRRSTKQPSLVRRILVVEPWNIGDVVLATPLLSQLRARFPQATISILAKSYAREILQGSGLIDEVIVCDLPWTAQKDKYRFTPAVLEQMRELVWSLRNRHFDIVLDARMDIRSNMLTALSGAHRRLGYDIGGGGWLLTDSLPSDRDETHKIDDWLALLQLVDRDGSPLNVSRMAPRLFVEDAERVTAAKVLGKEHGTRPVIGYHPGGSHPGKRWPRQRFEQLIGELARAVGGQHVVFLGPEDEGSDSWPEAVTVLRPSLRDLMALISQCDAFICNDSGPMHIADALDVPTVAIFEVGNPKWFGPSGSRSKVILGELAGVGLSAAPLDHPVPNPVPVSRVASAVREALSLGR